MVSCATAGICTDMYSFDLSEEQATESYDSVCGAYDRIFQQLDLPVQKGEGLC